MNEENDLAETFDAMRKASREKRASNRNQSAIILGENRIPFQRVFCILVENRIPFEIHNAGVHLIIDAGTEKIDFWPGTGKWITRKSGKTSRGVKKLIKFYREQG